MLLSTGPSHFADLKTMDMTHPSPPREREREEILFRGLRCTNKRRRRYGAVSVSGTRSSNVLMVETSCPHDDPSVAEAAAPVCLALHLLFLLVHLLSSSSRRGENKRKSIRVSLLVQYISIIRSHWQISFGWQQSEWVAGYLKERRELKTVSTDD